MTGVDILVVLSSIDLFKMDCDPKYNCNHPRACKLESVVNTASTKGRDAGGV
jgi:hypothetical protein